MASSDSAAGLGESEVAAWPILLQEELRAIDYYQPVLGLPDTLKAKGLIAVREQLASKAAAAGRVAQFGFVDVLEELKRNEKTSWKPLRGDGNSETSYPVLPADAAEAFRQEARTTLTAAIRELFPSLKDSDKEPPAADWQPERAPTLQTAKSPGAVHRARCRCLRRSAEADLGQDALAGQQFGAQADHEAHHGQAAIPGLSESDEAETGVGVSHWKASLRNV